MNFLEQIKINNSTHVVDERELQLLLQEAQQVYTAYFGPEVYFERSIFVNWTCAIADCKYCFLSTKPKYNPKIDKNKPIRSQESVLGEALICKALGWKIGYITGGLRVESADYLIDLVTKLQVVNGGPIMTNFGPYSRAYLEKFKPHVLGMGSAIESFNEPLHNFICPSKPLPSLMKFLGDLQELRMEKLITIILGMGERKEDVYTVIENIQKYNIEKIQLCFLKSQKNTVFKEVPPPNMRYMAWWVATIRIGCPQMQIKVALVRDRIEDFSLLLQAGANSFSRFMIFHDSSKPLAVILEKECQKAGRKLVGNFTTRPEIDVKALVQKLPFEEKFKQKVAIKAEQYYRKLGRGSLEEEEE